MTIKPTYANVAATAALILAATGAGGAAYAAGLANNTVGSPQIIDGAVRTVDLGTDAVTSPKVKPGSLGISDLNAGTRTALVDGSDAFHDRWYSSFTTLKAAGTTISEFTVPAGEYLLTASVNVSQGLSTEDVFCSIKRDGMTITTSGASISSRQLASLSLTGITVSDSPITLTTTCRSKTQSFNSTVDAQIVAVDLDTATAK